MAPKGLQRAGKGTTSLVTVHIYDLGQLQSTQLTNVVLKRIGTGAFHAGVEVFGVEWSYGYVPDPPDSTGVFDSVPSECSVHTYREAVYMGQTEMNEEDVKALTDELTLEWRGDEYDLLRRNCTHFSDTFCQRLGVGHLPGWVKNLAGAGATLTDGVFMVKDITLAPAIIAAAKAGEIDSKYHVTGTVQARAQDLSHHIGSVVGVLDDTLHVSQGSKLVVASTMDLASKAADIVGGKSKPDQLGTIEDEQAKPATEAKADAPAGAPAEEDTKPAPPASPDPAKKKPKGCCAVM